MLQGDVFGNFSRVTSSKLLQGGLLEEASPGTFPAGLTSPGTSPGRTSGGLAASSQCPELSSLKVLL